MDDYYKLNGGFVRLGDDIDDVETMYFGDGYNLVSMSREINVNLPEYLGDRID